MNDEVSDGRINGLDTLGKANICWTQFHLLALHIRASPQSHSSSPFNWDWDNISITSCLQEVTNYHIVAAHFKMNKCPASSKASRRGGPQPDRPHRKCPGWVWSRSCEPGFQDWKTLAPCEFLRHICSINIDLKHRKNCKCCPFHSLFKGHYEWWDCCSQLPEM